MLVANKESARS